MRMAFDTGVGVGVGLGGPAAKGETKLGARAEAAAQFQAGGKLIRFAESAFPIFDDDAFVSLLVTLIDMDEVVTSGSSVFSTFDDIDPMQWLRTTRVEMVPYAEGNAKATAGIVTNDDGTAESGEMQKWSSLEGKANLGAPSWLQSKLGQIGGWAQAVMSVGRPDVRSRP